MGADFDVDLKPGGSMSWSGPGQDGKPTRYVTGEVAADSLAIEDAPGDGEDISPALIVAITPRHATFHRFPGSRRPLRRKISARWISYRRPAGSSFLPTTMIEVA